MTRTICVVSGSRAEYGLLSGLMAKIAADPALTLTLAVTGSHLSPRFGHTADLIERDGFAIDARIPIPLDDDSPLAIARAAAQALAGFAEAFARLAPAIVVVLGDRFEILAAAQAALFLRVPLAHIHGGEVTEGMMDECIRHAVTKMAHLHFAAARPYAERLIRMGEAPERVHLVGAPGLEALRTMVPPSRAELAARLDFSLDGGPLLLATYHPTTLGDRFTWAADQLVLALQRFPTARVVLTGVNADPGNQAMRDRFAAFAARHPDRVLMRESLGQQTYLGLMRLADAVVGNSSSGVIEAPAARVATVNIGPRQDGRLKAASVIDCGEDADSIAAALTRALDPAFRAGWPAELSLYGQGDSAAAICKVLREVPLDGLLVKRFHD